MCSSRCLRLTACAVVLLVGVAWADEAPGLSEVQRLKAEKFVLSEQVAQLKRLVYACQGQLQGVAQESDAVVAAERKALEQEFLATMHVSPTCVWNWDTLRATCPPEATK